MATKLDVLYEALDQAIKPLVPAISDAFDVIYNVREEDRILSGKERLSDYLEWASDVAYEYEVKRCIKDCEKL